MRKSAEAEKALILRNNPAPYPRCRPQCLKSEIHPPYFAITLTAHAVKISIFSASVTNALGHKK